MLNETIRKQLDRKMEENNYNIQSLCTKAGVSPFTVRKFYKGGTNYPTVETLYKLAEFLNCSLDELTGRRSFARLDTKKDYQWNGSIYNSIVTIVQKYISEKEYKTSFDQATTITKEAYVFVIEKNKSKIDENFIKWIVDRNMDQHLI